jgi:hypothetical protein
LLYQTKQKILKISIMKKILSIAALSLLVFSSCKKDKTETKEKVFKGEAKTFQHGKAWTWYEEDEAGNPLRMAIAIDDEAMNSLDTSAPGGPGHHHTNAASLKLHPKAAATPFTHILVDWNPKGHDPEPIYGKPHFDFHFYTSSEAERMAIPAYAQDSTKFLRYPAPAYLPASYVPIPGGIPQMGSHWVDVTSPELSGAPFTQTFIYGTYNGKVNFYEPMITGEFIKANPGFERSIPQPAKFEKGGWYPTKMRISKGGGATNVIIEGFVQRQAL